MAAAQLVGDFRGAAWRRLARFRCGIDWWHIVLPVSRPNRDGCATVTDKVRRALDGEQTDVVKHRIVHPDGTIRIVQEEAEIVRNEDDAPLVMDGMVQDITEEEEREAELREAKDWAEDAAASKTRFQ
jgi:PAS domain-containing protein